MSEQRSPAEKAGDRELDQERRRVAEYMKIPAPGGGTQTVSADSAAAAAWAGNQGLGGANARGSVMSSLPSLPAATPTGSDSERARSVVALWAQSAPDDDVRVFCGVLLDETDSLGGPSGCALCGS